MNPDIEILEECLRDTFSFLNSLLEDEKALQAEIHNATAESALSAELQDKFQKQYQVLNRFIQDISRQVMMLEHFSTQPFNNLGIIKGFNSN